MPEHWKLRTVRADSGFFENAPLTFLESRAVPYIAESRGGLNKRKPLLYNILQWPGTTSPKLPPEPPEDGTRSPSPTPETQAS
jgi:hypothetical protein